MSDNGSFGKLVFYLAIVGITAAACGSANCGSPDMKLARAVENHGLTKVKVGDWAFMSCDASDLTERRFTATRADGQRVSGFICCGYFFKGCTVRW